MKILKINCNYQDAGEILLNVNMNKLQLIISQHNYIIENCDKTIYSNLPQISALQGYFLDTLYS
jgi:hypothetical protein